MKRPMAGPCYEALGEHSGAALASPDSPQESQDMASGWERAG